jgi:hypothetical protein
MSVNDPTNITGISKLINYDGNKNIVELEKNIVDNNDNENNDTNDEDIDKYKQQLEELGNALGISLDDVDNETTEDKESIIEDKVPDIDSIYNQVPKYSDKTNSYVERMTEEQKKQKILKHVLSGMEDQKFSVEKEKEEDDKAILLEQIDMLITNLKDEGIDVSRVPEVNNSSPLDDIENVHKILRLKNDRNRYCTFAEECILAASQTLEWLFDGKKTYLGRRPDVRGWSATVNIKLRRMRYDTSTFVSEFMQDYNLGHGTRIMLELFPSLFLYSKMKKSQYADNLVSSDEMNNAIDRIRNIEEKS